MIAGIVTGIACAFTVGYGVMKSCNCSNSKLKKKAKKALKSAKGYIDGLM